MPQNKPEELIEDNGSSARTTGVVLRKKIQNSAAKRNLEQKNFRTRKQSAVKNATKHSDTKKTSKKGRSSYPCNLCSLTFSQQQHLQKHLLGHQRNNCKFCSAQFTKRKALSKHLKMEHKVSEGEKLYKCTFCSRGFFKRPSLYLHLREHAEGKTVCLKCGHMSESEEAHAQHSRQHADAAKFLCVRCGERFRRKQQFEQHVMGHEKHVCNLCTTNFSTKKLLTKHRQAVHGIPVKEEKKHECGICKKRFQRPMLLQVHQRIHNDERPTQCSQCLKSFRTSKALSKHMKTVSHLKHVGDTMAQVVELEKPYLCAQCGAKFYRRQGLVRHMQQLHSDSKPLECPYCSYTCRCKTNLKRHIDLHTDSRRFVCELCGCAFHALATLKEHHAYVHSDYRGFICEQCGKGFKGKSGLKRHLRIHSDARPYVCQCGQSYKRMSHLKRHMVSAHHIQFESKRVKRIGDDDDEETSEDDLPTVEENGLTPSDCDSFTVVLTASDIKDQDTHLGTNEYILVKGLDKGFVGESLMTRLSSESSVSLEIPSLEFHLHSSSLAQNGTNFIDNIEPKINEDAFSDGTREGLSGVFGKDRSAVRQEKCTLSSATNGDVWNQTAEVAKLKEMQLPQIQYALSVPLPSLSPPTTTHSFSMSGSPIEVSDLASSPALYTDSVEQFLSV